jgi:hypothetical protein
MSGAASGADHGIDACTDHGPRTVLGEDQLPVVGIERGDRGVDGDLSCT